ADLEDIITADIEGLPAALPDGFKLINGYILGPKVRVPSSADLSGGNLAGLNLEDISMPNVDLSGANLTGTKLAGADIGWASPTQKDSESLPIIGEPASLPTHWELREGYLVDVTSPTLSLIGSQQLIHQIGKEYIDRGATAIDNEGFAVEVIVSGAVNGMMAGIYEIEYTATDDSGNISSVTRTITVADTIAPTLSLNGSPEVVHQAGVEYVDSGAAAIDNVDDVLDVVVTGQVDFMTVGEYQIQYTATDNAGNVGSVMRVVEVVDTTPPMISLLGDLFTTIEVNTTYDDPGALAVDNLDPQKTIYSTDIVNTELMGNYILRYNSVDSSANTSKEVFRNVRVVSGEEIYAIKNLTFEETDSNVKVIDCKKSVFGALNIPKTYNGKPVTTIEQHAFEDCNNLASVILPDGIKTIGTAAFGKCINLTSVTIPDSVTSISNWAFYECAHLKSVSIGSGVTSIGSYAFSLCYRLKNLTIGSSVTSIGQFAFARCFSLTSISIPESVNSIGYLTFNLCSQIKSITFEGNAPKSENYAFSSANRSAKIYVKANADGFDTTFGGLPVVREGSITTASKGNTSDGPIMDAVVFFDVNLNGLPDEGEPQTTSNGWGDYWLDIPLETYDLNGNGVIDISEGVIVSQGGTDTATGLPVKTTLKGPASATVITPLTTLVTRVMEQNPELDASAAAGKLEASLGIPDGVDILNFDTFKEASEENPSAADVLTATAKLQDTLVQGGNLIGGATGKSLQEGADAVLDAVARQVEAGDALDLDSKSSLKSLITEAASTSGANLTEAQTDGAASIMEASSKAKEDAKASASTVTELATEVSRVQAVSQSKAADDLEAVGAQMADLESTVLAYTGATMQQQVQTEVVGDLNASSYEAPVFNFQSASYTVNENGQQQPVIQINRTGDSFETVELTVTPIASSATAGEDFNGEPVSVSFELLEIRKTLDLQTLLIDDVLFEEPETFSLQLSVVRDLEDPDLPELPEGEEDVFPDRPTVGTISLATLTIISDDIANEAPTVSTIEDLVISEGAAQVSADFSVTDTDSSFDELTVQASTSNPFLISGLMVEGTASEQDASQWTLNFATVADRFGEGAITVEINDGYQSVSTSFNVTVSAVNNAPQITGVPSVIEAEGRKVVIPFEVSDDQTSAGNLFIYLTAQPLDYILKGHVLVVGNGAQRELILNNSGNAEGTGQFSVVVTDADGKTASQAFEVNFGGEPPVPVVPELKLNTSDPSNLTLSWEGDAQLLFTEDLSAGFEVVAGATSPYTIEQGNMGFFILRVEP
ncbi:leucine-rich repeat protein, partial [Verrucomicrobia bacterium]|nr:leucine-rich repeat protein [Verrucomicrobiota bacterium]